MDGQDQRSRHRGRLAARLVAAALAAAGAVPLLAVGVAEASPLPPPVTCSTIDFEQASVAPDPNDPTQSVLTVSGTKPSLSMSVSLNQLVYIQQPDFWGIEVVGCMPEIGLPATAPYKVTHTFTPPLGKCGVEVIGASSTQKFDLAGCEKPSLQGRWVLDPASLGVPVPVGKRITASFSADNVSGNSGCNIYSAAYRTGDGNAIKVGPIITTKIACDPVSNRAEVTYLGKLARATHFRVSDTELRLVANGHTLLRYKRATVYGS